jgi:alpha-beta hydrolase superfamily lysophospholipase
MSVGVDTRHGALGQIERLVHADQVNARGAAGSALAGCGHGRNPSDADGWADLRMHAVPFVALPAGQTVNMVSGGYHVC